MTYSSQRRTLLLAALTAPLALTLKAGASPQANAASAGSATSLAELERAVGGRLGVCALDTATGRRVEHRAGERFPFCSTFKAMLIAAVLAQSVARPALLAQRVTVRQTDPVGWSPVTKKHVGTSMTVGELCEATAQYSDNGAANLLMKLLGGPAAVTAFARSIGDDTFRLDRWELELNTALPGDARDTTTPAAMAASLRALALGDALPAPQRAQFAQWLRGNKTGDKRIRAGVPPGWQVGDKTGTGDYGTLNDIGVLWPPARGPIVLTVYYTQAHADAKRDDGVIVAATRIAIAALG
ncbi:PEN family class A beta-lactamase, Bcc-type [Burkholderia ubonensis]|uniref:Beta-lactamase n=1 Tax=Burkholderia ubonensis subsp. mesacidophila TaxID=265293 RepID=A0A2A4FJL4_9BURK|nr:PEN family class A beta-lactamase, Bcc-type [Burkholderia ubonensis]PCE32529.1 class A beta-lactamase [Burkholderia ubonensis subsp. mesacidophila]